MHVLFPLVLGARLLPLVRRAALMTDLPARLKSRALRQSSITLVSGAGISRPPGKRRPRGRTSPGIFARVERFNRHRDAYAICREALVLRNRDLSHSRKRDRLRRPSN